MFIAPAPAVDMYRNAERKPYSFGHIDNSLVNVILPAYAFAGKLTDIEVLSVFSHVYTVM